MISDTLCVCVCVRVCVSPEWDDISLCSGSCVGVDPLSELVLLCAVQFERVVLHGESREQPPTPCLKMAFEFIAHGRYLEGRLSCPL